MLDGSESEIEGNGENVEITSDVNDILTGRVWDIDSPVEVKVGG